MKPLFLASFLNPEEIKSSVFTFVEKLTATRAAIANTSRLQASAPATDMPAIDTSAIDVPAPTAANIVSAIHLNASVNLAGSLSVNGITVAALDSKNPLASFESALSGIPKDTPTMDIFIMGHGIVIANQHFIAFDKQDGHLKVSCIVRTKDLFSKIATALPHTQVSILLDSCFSAMAQADKDVLTIESSLYTLSSDETSQAAMPVNKTLEDYPAGQDYTPEQFISALLAKRAFNFASTKKDIPDHLVEMIPERVVKGTSGKDDMKMYVYNTRTMDKVALAKAIPALKAAINDDDVVMHFLAELHSELFSNIESEEAKTIHIPRYDPFLSWLALNTDTGVPFKPSAQFVNNMDGNIRLNVTFDQYHMLFHGDHKKDFSNPSIMDLLMIKYQEDSIDLHNAKQKNKDIAIDALIQKITDNVSAIPNPYAAANILCDITKDHLGEHFFRVGIVVSELDTITLMVIPMSDKDLSELLSGGIKSIYDYFVQRLHNSNLVKIFTDVIIPNLAEDVGAKMREVAPSLEEIGRMIVAKLDKGTDKLGASFCKQLDKAIANMVKFHELATFVPIDDMDLVTHAAAYAMSHDSPPDVVELELAGNPSIKYDMHLGEFMA